MPNSPELARRRLGSWATTHGDAAGDSEAAGHPNTDSDYDSSSSSSSDSPKPSLMHPTSLFPPFYNRPPTPLPPSPSLTSLLLPNRASATFSAPASPRLGNTPDHSPSASDTEGGNNDSHHHHLAPSYLHHRSNNAYNSYIPLSSTHLPHPPTPQHRSSSAGTNSTLGATDSSLAASSHIAFHTPRASPKVPTYEYYGFVLYLVSSLAFGMYILWSYLPSPILHSLGIHYYPSRWWCLALPSWLVILICYIYVALAAYNTGYLTKTLGSVEGVVDCVAKIAVVRSTELPPPPLVRGEGGGRVSGRDWKRYWNKGTDGVIDVPIGGVCEVLYGEGRELEGWEVEEEEKFMRETGLALERSSAGGVGGGGRGGEFDSGLGDGAVERLRQVMHDGTGSMRTPLDGASDDDRLVRTGSIDGGGSTISVPSPTSKTGGSRKGKRKGKHHQNQHQPHGSTTTSSSKR